MPDLSRLYHVGGGRTRSISPENRTGEPGKGGACPIEQGSAKLAARDLGTGWKVNPYIVIEPKSTVTIADIAGPGTVNHFWLTPTGRWRNTILRIYWEENENPSVECPIGDFFCMGWNAYAQISSLAVCVNPGSAFNCYWQMPFRSRCTMTLENIADEPAVIYYQIDYTLEDHPGDIAYFHAQFRRVNPLPYKQDYVILDGVKGKGQYVGTYLAWGSNSSGWWGEGEIKFFIDDDSAYPTICGTGTEDYFCGSYNFEDPVTHDRYIEYTTPYAGFYPVETDGIYKRATRFGLYRWHIVDPVRFDEKLRVTIQALGWREGGRYLPLQDDVASVAYWYQTLPFEKFPPLPDKDSLEVI